MNDCSEESPKMDAQMTAHVDKMLREYKTSRSKVAAADENVSPNTRTARAEESESTPDMPPVWAQKIAALRDKLWNWNRSCYWPTQNVLLCSGVLNNLGVSMVLGKNYAFSYTSGTS